MRTIHKYPLREIDHRSRYLVTMPADAVTLSVQRQGNDLVLYAIVDTMTELDIRRIGVVGTGKEHTFVGPYLGTLMQEGLVLHFFDEGWAR